MSNKANISIFIPHAGCPNSCSFCNQKTISGKEQSPTGREVTQLLTGAVERLSPQKQAEIAFFGGSFTAIPRDYMVELLESALPFVGQKGITGIRVSTRPDAISSEILAVLKAYKVTTIELGAQSTNDSVLTLNRRGHTYGDIEKAAGCIKQNGFALGLQMMTGLYGATPDTDRQTAQDLLALQPDMVRIYPTITLPDTHLYELYRQGHYTPPTLEETVTLCSELLLLFEGHGVPVIRLGLHGDQTVNGGIGPCHPALRELCEGELFYQTAKGLLIEHIGDLIVVNPKDLSKMIGQQKRNLSRLQAEGLFCRVESHPNIPAYTVGISRKENGYVPEIIRSTGLQILSR